MKFNELYNNLYIIEQDEQDVKSNSQTKTEVANPEDFNDVKPMPVPEPTEQPSSETQDGSSGSTKGSTLKDYIFKLEDFADALNGIESDSLQSLVAQLDKPLTPFEGISAKTKSDIVSVADTLRSISETLKLFIIGSARP